MIKLGDKIRFSFNGGTHSGRIVKLESPVVINPKSGKVMNSDAVNCISIPDKQTSLNRLLLSPKRVLVGWHTIHAQNSLRTFIIPAERLWHHTQWGRKGND